MTFKSFLQQQRLGVRTVALYVRIAKRWERANQDPQTWLAARLGARTPPGTHRSLCAAAVQWCTWKGTTLDRKGLPRIQRRQNSGRNGLTETELESYYALVESSWVDDPVYTILLLLPRTGLRVSEACELTHDAVQTRGRNTGILVYGKGGKERWVPLGEEGRRVMREYRKTARAAVLADAGEPDNGWLFPSPRVHGGHISASGVQAALRSIRGDMTGYARKVTPHVLRHHYATSLLAKGAQLAHIQALLGHSSIMTTSIYLHPTADALAADIDLID